MQCRDRVSDHTAREVARQSGVGREKEPDSEETHAIRYLFSCMRLSYLAQDKLGTAKIAKNLAQRKSELHEFDFIPLMRAARYLVGKSRAALRFRRQDHLDKITAFVDSDVESHPVSRKSATVLVAQIGRHTSKAGWL